MVFGILGIFTFKLWPSLQWNVTWCSLVAGCWHVGTIYCFSSPRVSYQLPSYACNIPLEWSLQMHHSWSLKSYTESYYGKLLLASEASERHGYCKPPPPPLVQTIVCWHGTWNVDPAKILNMVGWPRFFFVPAWPHLLWASLSAHSKRNFTSTPQYLLTELCWTEYRSTFVFTLCCSVWYTVYCLHFSMNCVRSSSLLHKTVVYKIKLEE